MLGNKKIIYFLCTGNSCRSQMAEGFTRHYFGEDFAIYSGGLYAKGVHPLSIKVMQERGINISQQTSDSINSEILMRASLVITLCKKAERSCPTLPKSIYTFHWGIEDPAMFVGSDEEVTSKFREIRDEIAEKVKALERILNRIKTAEE
ncbi:arsenate reductase [Brevibacillus aydinogluensis]|nr:arsenate reductase [Brevibacillus aydinogluensis]